MKNKYPQTSSQPNFPQIEEQILKYWQDNNIFQTSIDNRDSKEGSNNNEYIFYDGPPFANGLPHYGHLLTGFIKDIFARYQTIKGKKVERRFGWDCHGLPAEMSAEKDLKISGRSDIIKYGIDKFNDHCRTSVLKYTNEWQDYVLRQARWVDFANDYKTMDISYMESVIWGFSELYKKGFIYQSMRVMPYSWACETPLSNFETKMDNAYRERADKAVTVAFKLKNLPDKLNNLSKATILAWTTTPWTLPSNLALAIGDNIEYAYIEKDNEYIILAKNSVGKYLKELGIENADEIKGILSADELKGLNYEPLFPYFANHANSFKVLVGEFVTEGDGTGIVHLAPGFGEDDQMLCSQHNIELVCPVDGGGKFTSEVSDFTDMQVFEANDPIIIYLKNNNLWIKTEQYLHNYPHCWRTDTPLIYKAVPSWYVNVGKFKDKMIANNKQINWIPGHIKDGLFGKWLENAKDWSISRNRFFGTPIPIWLSDNPKYPRIEVYGSIKELEEAFGVTVTDLHRPFIDQLTKPNPDDPTGKSMMRRVEDVFDCWFESGSMPFAQVHYPFDNKDWFESHFPADFIVEYIAQTRGWFYTLIVLSTALFDRPPFLNCICHGVILDGNGQKLSKRLGNYADPRELFNQYGADTLRFLMVSSNVMKGEEFLIDKDGVMVKDTLRLVIKPIWNAYNFFTLYANSDDITAKSITKSTELIDKYILYKLQQSVIDIERSMDGYDTISACNIIVNFFEILNNWYIRRCRSRFWKSIKDNDKQQAYDTLYTVLDVMTRAICPILPLVTEEIYRGINFNAKSVHLTRYPNDLNIEIDHELTRKMDKVREICSVSLSIRNDENIRTRLPLKKLELIGSDLIELVEFEHIIKDEVNVKEIIFLNNVDTKASYQLQLNFPNLGKRLAQYMKDIISAVKAGNWSSNDGVIEVLGHKLLNDEAKLILVPIDKKNTRPLSSGNALIVLDLEITDELNSEGIARDIVRLIQQMRKDKGFDISDNIKIRIDAEQRIIDIIKNWNDYIQIQTLSIFVDNNEVLNFQSQYEIDDLKITIFMSKNDGI